MWIYFTLKQTNIEDNTSQLLWIEINGSTYNNLWYETFTSRNFFNVIKDLDNFNSIEPNDYSILKYHTYLMNTTSANNLTIVIPRRYK